MWANRFMEAISIYIHIPFCLRKCDYCAFFSIPATSDFDYKRYVDCLCKEFASYDLSSYQIRTIYIGGGSPSILPICELTRLAQTLCEIAGSEIEFSVEINPAQIGISQLTKLRNSGVNRLSIGAQSFCDKELRLLTRSYNSNTIFETYAAARESGFENISLDLIFALPSQTLAQWNENIDKAIALAPEHISAYSLSYESGTSFAQKLESGNLIAAGEELEREMYELAISKFSGAGILQYEISNFARRGYECSHNLCYWQNTQYVGLGAGASSNFKRRRLDNIAAVESYMRLIENGETAAQNPRAVLDKQFACETAVLMLRLRGGIELENYRRICGIDLQEIFAEVIDLHIDNGNLILQNGKLFISEKTLPIADTVLCDFSSF